VNPEMSQNTIVAGTARWRSPSVQVPSTLGVYRSKWASFGTGPTYRSAVVRQRRSEEIGSRKIALPVDGVRAAILLTQRGGSVADAFG
jgi:hypothetical protein